MKALTLFLVLTSATTYGQSDRRIEKSAVIDAPVSDVWKAWTTADGLQSFLCQKANVELKLGGRYEIFFSTQPPLGQRGSEGCQVLSFIPERMLSFTWNAPPSQPTMRLRHTFVVLQLTPTTDGKTKLDLTHAGWRTGPDWDETYAYFDKAWGSVLSWCQDRFKNGPRATGTGSAASEKREDSVLSDLAQMIGGTWRGEVKDPQGKPMVIEFKYRRHPDGVGVIGEGEIGKGRKDAVHIHSMFGWDAQTSSIYYFDSHDSGTVYWGHVAREGNDLVFVFGPAGGDTNAFTSRSRFTDKNSLASIIRNAKGEEVVGLTLKRK